MRKIEIFYHSTCVVTIDNSGELPIVTLRSGGWHTSTTKRRMNQAAQEYKLGFCVYQEKFNWYVGFASGIKLQFEDGMKFDVNGRIITR
jgi:hypothetical protein